MKFKITIAEIIPPTGEEKYGKTETVLEQTVTTDNTYQIVKDVVAVVNGLTTL